MKRDVWLSYLLVVSYIFMLPACATPLRYSAEPIEATVIDAETKQPLEGVIVTANWQLEEGTLGGNVQAGQLKVMETITDKDGRFRFPSWGPITVWKGHLVNEDPQLLLFKSGYEYKRLDNHISFSRYREYVLKPVRSSDWNGKTIAMNKFAGTPRDWLKNLERVIPPYERLEDARRSLMLRAILSEENSIPDSEVRKRPFFDNIVRRLLEGK